MDKIPMTAEGYAALEADLKHCREVERPRIIEQIADARGADDLSENVEYHAATELQSLNEARIAELEDKLARAEVIDTSKLSGETITFGATVTLLDEETEKKSVWKIVGEPEADAKRRKTRSPRRSPGRLSGRRKVPRLRSQRRGARRITKSSQSNGRSALAAGIGHALPEVVGRRYDSQDARLVQHFEEPILPP